MKMNLEKFALVLLIVLQMFASQLQCFATKVSTKNRALF